ncbi:Scarecrow-like protein 6, partial [Striga hermonthica]
GATLLLFYVARIHGRKHKADTVPGKGVLELEQLFVHNKKFVSDFAPQISSDYLFQKNCFFNRNSYSFVEPTSVLDSARIPSRPASSSTPSSSLGGGGGGAASADTAGVAAVSDAGPSPKWQQHDSTTATSGGGGADPDLLPVPPSLDICAAGGNTEKFAMEDWEGVLSESVAVSPGGEHSLFRWIMGDPEDPSSMGGLSRGLHIGDGGGGSTTPELDFGGGFSASVDQGFGSGECFLPAVPNFPTNSRSEKGNSFSWASNNSLSSNPPTNFKFSQNITQNPSPPFNPNLSPIAFDSSPEIKPPIFNPQLLINHHQAQNTQNPSLFLPLSLPQHQGPNLFGPPQPKRHNPGETIDVGFQPGGLTPKGPFTDTGQPPEFLMARENLHPHQLQFLPPYLHHRPTGLAVGPGPRPKPDDCHQLQQTVVDQIYKAAELVQIGNPNLIQFASEVNIGFEFDVMDLDSLSSGSWPSSFGGEAVVVNLPISSLASSCQLSPPFVLRFVKQLSPRIVVSVEKGFERNDLPFANHIIHALQSCSNLLESLDAVNMNVDSLQKIERFLLQPAIEKIVSGRFRAPEKTQHWRALFLSNGFSPVMFSNLTESQAECVIKRTPVRGFEVEKRQSSLVLCWQRKELISASAWRC